MGLECLKMQTNCLDLSSGNRSAEAPGGTVAKEVVQGGASDGLNELTRLSGAESRPCRRFVGGGQMAHQQRRGKYAYRMVERFTSFFYGKGTPSDAADDLVERFDRPYGTV